MGVSRYRRAVLLVLATALLVGGSAFAATGGPVGAWIRGTDHRVPVVRPAVHVNVPTHRSGR